ncbi:hypothetical protein Clacol_002307 [Clathrus columnatus]|uniref:DOMON domain-containing protein n=1 Tax=Clathrus columnatus TaxID=1419009 RepID=A0AAV5A0H5_9AGAM|nr:hypothetical protein Clacol_002307 [Clathrus columnatus]
MKFSRALVVAGFYSLINLVAGQSSTQICDANGICFEGYQDPTLDTFVGIILPPLTTPPSTEYIVQLVAPISYGWTGASMGGQMADSLLFVFWPSGDDVVFSSRWTDGYVQPLLYAGPTVTMLSGSGSNGTHLIATFRCQNCTSWDGGSIDPSGSSQVLAYATSTDTPVDDPTNPASNFTEHNDFNFFGLVTANAISSDYQSILSKLSPPSSAPTSSAPSSSAPSSSPSHTSAPSSPSPSSTSPSHTTSASGAEQTKYGQW